MTESAEYPALDTLMNAYLHQDWIIFGPVLAQVVDAFILDSGAPTETAAALTDDVARFLAANADDVANGLLSRYPSSTQPEGWNMQAREWLDTLVAHADAAAGVTPAT